MQSRWRHMQTPTSTAAHVSHMHTLPVVRFIKQEGCSIVGPNKFGPYKSAQCLQHTTALASHQCEVLLSHCMCCCHRTGDMTACFFFGFICRSSKGVPTGVPTNAVPYSDPTSCPWTYGGTGTTGFGVGLDSVRIAVMLLLRGCCSYILPAVPVK
jgi:hypothetical protein